MPETPDKKQDDKQDDKAKDTPDAGGETPPTYEEWFKTQDETTQGLIDGHTTGLKSALDAERGTRKDLETKLREAASNLEAGSEARKALEETAASVAADGDRADFYEGAHAQGVTDLRLAWLVVSSDDTLQDRRGNVNFEKLKDAHPTLFAGESKPPPGNAGAGADTPKSGGSMNDFILAAANQQRQG